MQRNCRTLQVPFHFQVLGYLATACVLAQNSEKQIKLEDIEKDNLKAAQQAKYEKQYEQYQQYQQPGVQYDPQVYSQPGLAYQSPSPYSQYLAVPQQYLQQQQPVYSGEDTSFRNIGSHWSRPKTCSVVFRLQPIAEQ